MAYNLEPRTIKENLLGLIGKNPHAEPRPANTREECFLADIAENGGGGGGLPPYTSADKGKVLTVGEEPNVIVPETTLTSEDFEYYEPFDAYLYKYSGQLVSGSNYVLHFTTSGVTDDYSGTAISKGDAIIFVPEDGEPPFQIIYSPSMFGEYIVFAAGENLPAGLSVIISFSDSIVVAKWSFNEGGGGLVPEGRIGVNITGNFAGSGVKIYGIFSKTDSFGNVTYEQGEHTFSFSQIIDPNQQYAVAVPTVGEGEEEHIDFYLAFASANNGSPAASGYTTTMSTQGVTFDRMKNQSNQNRDVWHIVTPNGITTCNVTVRFYQS